MVEFVRKDLGTTTLPSGTTISRQFEHPQGSDSGLYCSTLRKKISLGTESRLRQLGIDTIDITTTNPGRANTSKVVSFMKGGWGSDAFGVSIPQKYLKECAPKLFEVLERLKSQGVKPTSSLLKAILGGAIKAHIF